MNKKELREKISMMTPDQMAFPQQIGKNGDIWGGLTKKEYIVTKMICSSIVAKTPVDENLISLSADFADDIIEICNSD